MCYKRSKAKLLSLIEKTKILIDNNLDGDYNDYNLGLLEGYETVLNTSVGDKISCVTIMLDDIDVIRQGLSGFDSGYKEV